jgi:hypothetical protein
MFSMQERAFLDKEKEDECNGSASPTRQEFEIEAFNMVLPSLTADDNEHKKATHPSNSQMLTPGHYSNIITVVEYWNEENNPQSITMKEYRKQMRLKFKSNAYKWGGFYKVARNVKGDAVLYRKPTDKRSTWRLAVHHLQVFDVIKHAHSLCGHMASRTTFDYIADRFSNITLDLVQAFCRLCTYCIENNQPKKLHIDGAKTPIRSFDFRDRFQFDLIDYRNDPQHMVPFDTSTPICNYLLVGKDHLAKFQYLRPLARKNMDQVAYEINFACCLLGYPAVFQTDNGTEFMNEVLKKIKEMNPYCVTVNGRVRTPSDQGSVERSNAIIKQIIQKMVKERQAKEPCEEMKKHHAWTSESQTAMAVMNKTSKRGVPSAYEIVFGGRKFDDPIYSALLGKPTEEILQVEEMVLHLDQQFKNMMIEAGFIEPDDIEIDKPLSNKGEEADATAYDVNPPPPSKNILVYCGKYAHHVHIVTTIIILKCNLFPHHFIHHYYWFPSYLINSCWFTGIIL